MNDQLPSRKIETVNNVYELPANTTCRAASFCPLVSLLREGCQTYLSGVNFRYFRLISVTSHELYGYEILHTCLTVINIWCLCKNGVLLVNGLILCPKGLTFKGVLLPISKVYVSLNGRNTVVRYEYKDPPTQFLSNSREVQLAFLR